MSNIPKMGHLTTPEFTDVTRKKNGDVTDVTHKNRCNLSQKLRF